jgi:cellobiose phosphorylase
MTNVDKWRFIDDDGSFTMDNPDKYSYLYFPLANAFGMMSSITPTLAGDAKTGQNTFLLPPVSVEDLQASHSARNFWIYKEGIGPWSATGASARQISGRYDNKNNDSQEKSSLESGFLWHKVTRESPLMELKSELTSFVPCEDEAVELTEIVITNLSAENASISATSAVPIYGRSADNIRDHRHVTSLLHRVEACEYGIKVSPTLLFDEHGYSINRTVYAVLGSDANACSPDGFFPTIESFIGEGGTIDWPQAVVLNREPSAKCGDHCDGYEAIGALHFRTQTLRPGEKAVFILALCINPHGVEEKYLSIDKFAHYLAENKEYWKNKITVKFKTGSRDFDLWMKWVACEPILRRIFGCSFLPHHDYGRGGRGWRDLWQDCLALLVMEPDKVGEMLFKNCAGMRFDGTNATIIGAGEGQFIADRNNITRVWMDHASWPLCTINFYINQSGDLDFLLCEQTYFKDKLSNRGKTVNKEWNEDYGTVLKTCEGKEYKGTIMEHLLIENLAAYYNVGKHGMLRLENADWNDALDMAAENGESVAFSSMYCGNLNILASLLRALMVQKGITKLKIAEELKILLQDPDDDTTQKKLERLGQFCDACAHEISGETVELDLPIIIYKLETRAARLSGLITKNERVTSPEGYQWFNGYYNNDGEKVEGYDNNSVHMTLAGQVFAIMFGVADAAMTAEIVLAADKYLYSSDIGGYKLNTDFKGIRMNLGRQFGFAYGHKENGSVFSHMVVMFANALYQRGFVHEGYKALNALCSHCMSFEKSRIYPGVPEYIDPKGRGMYDYLTGSASWLILTFLSEVFGIKGNLGNLTLSPKLLSCQFDESGDAVCETLFRGHSFRVVYHNPSKLDYGEYAISGMALDGNQRDFVQGNLAELSTADIDALNCGVLHVLEISLERNHLS